MLLYACIYCPFLRSDQIVRRRTLNIWSDPRKLLCSGHCEIWGKYTNVHIHNYGGTGVLLHAAETCVLLLCAVSRASKDQDQGSVFNQCSDIFIALIGVVYLVYDTFLRFIVSFYDI